MDRRGENPLPASESQSEWANSAAVIISDRGSKRISTAENIAMTAFTVGVVAVGGVLGGKFAGDGGAFAGGLLGLASGISVSRLIRDLIHGQPTS